MKHARILALLGLTLALAFDRKGNTFLKREEVDKLDAALKAINPESQISGAVYDEDGFAQFSKTEIDNIEAALTPAAEETTDETVEETTETVEETVEESAEATQITPAIEAVINAKVKASMDAFAASASIAGPKVIKIGGNKAVVEKTFGYNSVDATRPWNIQAAALESGISFNDLHLVAGASSTDYSKLNEDLGEYYRTSFKNDLNSFINKMDDLRKIFTMYSNIQDESVIVNTFLGEFSQAFQDDFTPKGSYKFEAEKIKMYDVKFDHTFKNMKALEKNWLGKLNTNGSNAIKEPFVKFLLFETMKKLNNEQQLRRINGVYVAPTEGVAGSYLTAANGLRKLIKVKIAENKIKTFSIGETTKTNVIDNFKAAVDFIPEHIRTSGPLNLYCSQDLFDMYIERNKELYARDFDYKSGTNQLPLNKSNVTIVAIPNMGNSQRIILTFAGNICLAEDKPNEMNIIQMEQEKRQLHAWSDWKESVFMIFVGKVRSNMDEANYEDQFVWTNDLDLPSSEFIAMTADDTTPSCLEHTSLVSVANTVATAITNIDDMAIGQTVILKCGSDTNAITIAKSGNFAKMTAAWSPSKGDTITLFKRGANDIVDLERTTTTSDAIVIAADDTTPSVADGNKFITSANTQATAITNFDDAVAGETYTIYGGSSTNASTIANSGNFVLSAAMTLSADTWIELYYNHSGKFVETKRNS